MGRYTLLLVVATVFELCIGEFVVDTNQDRDGGGLRGVEPPSKNSAILVRDGFVLMLQESSRIKICGPGRLERCEQDNEQIIVIALFLTIAILCVVGVFQFIREDKEEQITPLVPQLIVKGGTLHFQLPLNTKEDGVEVTDDEDNFICKVVTDWPDPMRPGFSGVAATVRIMTEHDITLVTVVFRTVAVQGQGICVCREGSEIFGFIEPDAANLKYTVKHRTNVHLLTLTGDFSDYSSIEMINPVALKVCSVQKSGGVCKGEIVQHTDAGLMICSLFAAYVNGQLAAAKLPSSPWAALPYMAPVARITEGAGAATGAQDATSTEEDDTPDR